MQTWRDTLRRKKQSTTKTSGQERGQRQQLETVVDRKGDIPIWSNVAVWRCKLVGDIAIGLFSLYRLRHQHPVWMRYQKSLQADCSDHFALSTLSFLFLAPAYTKQNQHVQQIQ